MRTNQLATGDSGCAHPMTYPDARTTPRPCDRKLEGYRDDD